MGAGISGGGHVGPTRTGARLGGRARPPPLWPAGEAPWCVFSARNSQLYYKKIILNFQGIWRTFIFGIFFIAQIIQKQTKNTIFSVII